MKKHRPSNQPTRFSDVELLQSRIATQTPPTGEYFYDYKLEEAKQEETFGDDQAFHAKYKINFSDLPISIATLKGLHARGFSKMTEVQRCAIPHAMADRDLLVSSRTGSGKTLAYLVPLVQKLYRNRFIPMDGLGALIIVPVRQLAIQVFQVLNSFSEKLEMSVGLTIGGKEIRHQKDQLHLMNILVATPGRLLQHLEETYGFETNNLKMLVLDEADVMMEMGFKQSLKAIMKSLPNCQTLMFSATITKDIYDLISSNSQPEKILLQGVSSTKQIASSQGGTFSGSAYETPSKLMQYYMIVPPEDKINTFYSFLKTHQKQKIIVFLSTCKQVRFLYESFRKFRLGTPLYELQGHQKQKKRMAIYFTFCEKRHGVLLCTNIAARGLDFPMVDWVVQMDIPDDPDLYVHRVGRTARYKAEGKALMFVSQQEKPFVDTLKVKGVNLHKINQNPQRYLRVQSSLQSICSQHQDVKYLAQRALISYLKFVYKAHNKEFFNLKKIDLQKLAHSFGLLTAPTINIKGQQAAESEDEQDQEEEQRPKMSKIEMMRMKQKEKKNEMRRKKLKAQSPAQEQQPEQDRAEQQEDENEEQSDGELFKTKSVVRSNQDKVPLTTSKRQLKKIKNEGHFDGRNKIHFDDDLKPISNQEYRRVKRLQANKVETTYNRLQQIESRLEQNRQDDDLVERQRRQDKRRKKDAQKQIRRRGGEFPREATLGFDDDNDEEFD